MLLQGVHFGAIQCAQPRLPLWRGGSCTGSSSQEGARVDEVGSPDALEDGQGAKGRFQRDCVFI